MNACYNGFMNVCTMLVCAALSAELAEALQAGSSLRSACTRVLLAPCKYTYILGREHMHTFKLGDIQVMVLCSLQMQRKRHSYRLASSPVSTRPGSCGGDKKPSAVSQANEENTFLRGLDSMDLDR